MKAGEETVPDTRPDDLAILGGAPVRTQPFTVEPMVDGEEERRVLDAVREKNFSRYIGARMPEIDRLLRMTSVEAAAIDAEWHVLGGPNVRGFGAEFAGVFDVPFAIPVSSATAGLSVALAAAGVGPGDEVILPAISFSASANAVLMFNSIPVFVDVDPESFCLDPARVEAAITPSTRAILVVHLTGNVADMDTIGDIARRHDLIVIEDAAQAIGATYADRRVGTLGDAGVFSFQQSKNIMTGEGGMIVTHDPELARRARLILNHGEAVFDDESDVADLANIIGFNFRLPELCAAVGRAQLGKLDAVNDWRTRNADRLRAGLADLPGLTPAPSQRESGGCAREVPHLFVALYDVAAMGFARWLFVEAMRAEGVPVGTGYERPLYAAPMFLKKVAYGEKGCPWSSDFYQGNVVYARGDCPVAESLLFEKFIWFYHIAHPSSEADMDDVVAAVRKVVGARDRLAAEASRFEPAATASGAGRFGVQYEQGRKG